MGYSRIGTIKNVMAPTLQGLSPDSIEDVSILHIYYTEPGQDDFRVAIQTFRTFREDQRFAECLSLILAAFSSRPITPRVNYDWLLHSLNASILQHFSGTPMPILSVTYNSNFLVLHLQIMN